METKMEMEMRAAEAIEIGTDLTPPIPPLTQSLHNPFLSSHCPSCFSPLHCCSCLCLSSASCPLPSADLRAAHSLLLTLFPFSPSPRLSGLLTNHQTLLSQSDDLEISIREGARVLASAIRENGTVEFPPYELEELASCCLCLVITNAVEVRDSQGRALGIAVYGPEFSWINHSCSPNASYRFVFSPPSDSSRGGSVGPGRIVPAVRNGGSCLYDGSELAKGCSGYEPRLIVRSIKRIKKGEEVTVAYTDLLQPKVVRQLELWSKYCFVCCCRRCTLSPEGYVDRKLKEIVISKEMFSRLSSHDSYDIDEPSLKMADYADEVITEYLSTGDAESCCEKLEILLIHGFHDKQLETSERNSQHIYWLQPLHYLAFNMYTTLASAYKVHASNLSIVCSEGDVHCFEASFRMSRISVAYSLLLAAGSYHLFCFESSLIGSVANFWVSAGESLLDLAKSSTWESFNNPMLPAPSSTDEYRCLKCSLLEGTDMIQGQIPNTDSVMDRFPDCISVLSQRIWGFLIQDCDYLEIFVNSIDYGRAWKLPNLGDVKSHLASRSADVHRLIVERKSGLEAPAFSGGEKDIIFQLGVHCLYFGRFLSTLCYCQCSNWKTCN